MCQVTEGPTAKVKFPCFCPPWLAGVLRILTPMDTPDPPNVTPLPRCLKNRVFSHDMSQGFLGCCMFFFSQKESTYENPAVEFIWTVCDEWNETQKMIRYTVDGRNPATPGMYKNHVIWDKPSFNWYRISSTNTIIYCATIQLVCSYISIFLISQENQSTRKNQLLPAVAMLSKTNIIQRFKTKVSVKFHQQMDSSRN